MTALSRRNSWSSFSIPGQGGKRQEHQQPAQHRRPPEKQAPPAAIGCLPKHPRILPHRSKETWASILGFPPDEPRILPRAVKDIPPIHLRHMDTTIDINNGENQVKAHVGVVNNFFGQTSGAPEPRPATVVAITGRRAG